MSGKIRDMVRGLFTAKVLVLWQQRTGSLLCTCIMVGDLKGTQTAGLINDIVPISLTLPSHPSRKVF